MPAERRGAITGASTQSSLVFSSSSSSIYTSNATSSVLNPAASNTTFTMSSFNLGSAPAPGAPAPSAFNFGTNFSGAPASGSLFGSTTPAAGGFFGSTASAPGFGSPAPAPGGGGLFGSAAPAPPTTTFGYGGTPAPMTAFGAPAPATSFGFGGTPGPATGMGVTAGFGAPAPGSNFGFGGTQAPSMVTPSGMAGFTPYPALSPPLKQMIDGIYQAMMQHKRTLLAVQSMEPKLLEKPSAAAVMQQADAAAGPPPESQPLAVSVQQIAGQIHQLEQKLADLNDRMMRTKHGYEAATTQAITYAQWPTEAVAMRAGVTLTTNTAPTSSASSPNASDPEQKKAEEVRQQLQILLNRAAATVDRIERMPSPYLWQCIEDMEGRVQLLMASMQNLKQAVDVPPPMASGNIDVVAIARLQEDAIWKVGVMLANVHTRVEQVRQLYRNCERGADVLELANQEELRRQRQLDDKMKIQMITNLAPTAAPSAGSAPGTSLFGNTSAPPAFSGGSSLFGAAPSPGYSLFPSNPAPSPAAGSAPLAFGGSSYPTATSGFAPTPASTGGGLFGSSAPAPGTTGFATTPTPAFAAPAPAFGAAPVPAFGTAPAPAFGAPPAPGFGIAPAPAFGAPPALAATPSAFGATSSTPKSKNKSRSTRRR